MNSHPFPPDRDQEFRTIEEKAAEWFGRCEIGLTAEQEREFVRWLEIDTRHGEAMREMDDTWEFLDGLKEIERPAASARGIQAHVPHSGVSLRKRMVWPQVLAVAAAIAVAVAGFWQPWRQSPVVRQAATEPGGMKKLDLPDGSTVHLNASSSVDVRFTHAERHVHLSRGEAHFVVASDAARPFVVIAGDVAVRAVGTAFNVRHEAQAIEVFVTEGKVRVDDATKGESLLTRAVSPATSPPRAASIPADSAPAPANVGGAEPGLLVAGQRALVQFSPTAAAQPAVVAPIAPEEIQQALAWRARQLEFDMTPLTDVVAEFNRYNSHQLVIADAQLGQQPFGGSFHADNHRVFVRLLEQRFGVTAERTEEKTILRRAK